MAIIIVIGVGIVANPITVCILPFAGVERECIIDIIDAIVVIIVIVFVGDAISIGVIALKRITDAVTIGIGRHGGRINRIRAAISLIRIGPTIVVVVEVLGQGRGRSEDDIVEIDGLRGAVRRELNFQ